MNRPLSVVIPAFNEEQRILPSLRTLQGYLSLHHPQAEVLVVDDGSRDGTQQVVAELVPGWPGLRVLPLGTNQGKGQAIRIGVLAAEGEWILCSDADLSVPIENLEAMLARGADAPVVIASRTLGRSMAERAWRRRAMSWVFNHMVRLLAVRGIGDTQCGFKLYRRDAARAIFERLTIQRFAFDVEVLFLAHKLGYPIAEVPVSFQEDSRTTIRMATDPLHMLIDVAKIRWRHVGKP